MQPRISPNSLYYGLLTGIHITIKQSVNHNKDCQAISNQNSQGAIWYPMTKLTDDHIWLQHIVWYRQGGEEGYKSLFLRTAGSEEAQAPPCLAFRYHAAALARVEGLQEPHHLVHVRPLIWVRVPALAHDVRHRAWAAPGDVRAQILHRQNHCSFILPRHVQYEG